MLILAISLIMQATHGLIVSTEYHVGAPDMPNSFASLNSVKAHLKAHPPAQPTIVHIHKGLYPPFSLSAEDSVSSDAPIKWVASPTGSGTPVEITAGHSIPNEAFTPVGAGPLVRADLFAHGIKSQDLGEMITGSSIGDCQHSKTDLVFGGTRQTLARWPNINSTDGGWRFANIDSATVTTVSLDLKKQPGADRILNEWSHENDAWIHGYWTFDWTDSYVSVGNITGVGDGVEMTMLTPTTIKPNARFGLQRGA